MRGAAFMLAGLAIGSGQDTRTSNSEAGSRRDRRCCTRKSHHAADDAIAANGGPVFGRRTRPASTYARNVFRNNNTSRPHYHDGSLGHGHQGHVVGGTGKVFRQKEMKPMPAGSVMFHPA